MSKKPKTKCDVVGDTAAWILGVVSLVTLGFICGQIYFHRQVEVPLRSYNKMIYQKYQELHKIALDLEAKLKSKSSDPIAIHEGEVFDPVAADLLQLHKILSETQSNVDNLYETFSTNFMDMMKQ